MCPHPSKPNSFAVAIRDRDWFKEVIRTKLVLEVAGGTPERRIVPVAEMQPRVPCLIGERISEPQPAVSVGTILEMALTVNPRRAVHRRCSTLTGRDTSAAGTFRKWRDVRFASAFAG